MSVMGHRQRVCMQTMCGFVHACMTQLKSVLG